MYNCGMNSLGGIPKPIYKRTHFSLKLFAINNYRGLEVSSINIKKLANVVQIISILNYTLYNIKYTLVL